MSEEIKGPERKSIRGLKASIVAQGANLVITILKTVLFTFFIAPEHFGIIALSMTFTGIVQLINDMGFSTYIIQKKDIENRELVSINTTLVLLGVGATIVTALLAVPVAWFYEETALYWVLPITGLQFIMSSFILVPMALMRKNMEFDNVGKVHVFSNFVSVLVGIALLVFMRNYWVLLAVTTSYFICQLFLTFRYNKWKYQFANPFRQKLSLGAVDFGKRLTLFNIITFISVNIDNLIIAKMAGSAALGLYSKSYDLGVMNLERAVKNPIGQVYFSDISGKTPERQSILLFQYLFLLVSVLVLIIGPFLIYYDWAILTFLDADWEPLIGLMPPFFLSAIIWMTLSLTDQLLVSNFNTKRFLYLGVFKAVVGLIAIFLASFWGVKAIAWSFFIYHLIVYLPMCSGTFNGIGLEKQKARAFLINLLLLVISAMALVTVPYLLRLYGFLGRNFSLAFFLVSCALVYFKIWPQLFGFAEFKLFMRALFSKSSLAIGT